MPSTRPTPKTASGASRPLVSAKTDTRLKGAKPGGGRSFYIGDSTVADVKETSSGIKGLTVTYSNKNIPGSTTRPYTSCKANKDAKEKKNAGVKAMGSYAKNYFKNNSK